MFQIPDWEKFQHYKDRTPPWIKLSRSILDDYDFHCLPDASKAIAPMLWLLASEYEDPKMGIINLDIPAIAFRLRMTEKKVEESIKPLIGKFIIDLRHDDSDMLAPCYQDATPETEGETKKEAETKGQKKNEEYDSEFLVFMDLYPKERKDTKSNSFKAWKKALTKTSAQEIIDATRRYAQSEEVQKGFAKGTVAWLNAERWTYDYRPNAHRGNAAQSIRRSEGTLADARKEAGL